MRTLSELFARAVATRADGVAIVYPNQCLSFADLDRASDALASWLVERGVQSGDRVSTILQNTPDMAITALATWKCGGVLMPCNPMYRHDEFVRLFTDARPRVVVHDIDTGETVRSAAASAGSDILVLPGRAKDGLLSTGTPIDLALVLRDHAGQQFHPVAREADDLAMLLYTSGTTGVPKGAMLSNANLVFSAEICRTWFRLDANSRILAVAPLFHITGLVCHLLAAFAAACPVALMDRFQPDVALKMIRGFRPTFTIGAITAFVALMSHPGTRDDDFASFELIYSGGAPIPTAVTAAFRERFEVPIHLSFGMTETSAPVLLNPVGIEAPLDPESETLAVGVPVDATEVRIVDDEGVDLPRGTRGELLIRGPQVMQGYWHRPEETAAALEDGWMHSGDIAVQDADGWCYIVDRKKDMICASGFKIWPREVEDVLYGLDGVREVVVVGKPDSYRGETVVAYLSLRHGASIDVSTIIRHARTKLAAYKCPREVAILDDLPKTATGKLSRAVLRERAAREPSALTG